MRVCNVDNIAMESVESEGYRLQTDSLRIVDGPLMANVARI